MPDYLGLPDSEIGPFVANLEAKIKVAPANYGLVAADVIPVTTALTAWNTDYPAHLASQAAADSNKQTKDSTRFTMESAVRVATNKSRGSGQLSDAEAADLGLPVYDVIPTPAGAPTTAPIGQVDTSERLRHRISVADSTTPTSKAKPPGVQGAEIRVKIGGPPPVDPSELEFVTIDSRPPHTVEYDGEDAGKTAHYMIRWVSTRGAYGPWSETVSATITG